MHDPYTALIELRDPLTPLVRDDIRAALRKVHGVREVDFAGMDPVTSVAFDARKTGIAELVRVVEDLGLGVVSIAQRAVEELPRIEVIVDSVAPVKT